MIAIDKPKQTNRVRTLAGFRPGNRVNYIPDNLPGIAGKIIVIRSIYQMNKHYRLDCVFTNGRSAVDANIKFFEKVG